MIYLIIAVGGVLFVVFNLLVHIGCKNMENMIKVVDDMEV